MLLYNGLLSVIFAVGLDREFIWFVEIAQMWRACAPTSSNQFNKHLSHQILDRENNAPWIQPVIQYSSLKKVCIFWAIPLTYIGYDICPNCHWLIRVPADRNGLRVHRLNSFNTLGLQHLCIHWMQLCYTMYYHISLHCSTRFPRRHGLHIGGSRGFVRNTSEWYYHRLSPGSSGEQISLDCKLYRAG